jgi:hypothetical protein
MLPRMTTRSTAPVRGLLLRYALVVLLTSAGRPMPVRELVLVLDHAGIRSMGRASKDISDALRWEMARGRVHRRGRGVYVAGHVPRQTVWRMRRRLADEGLHLP